MVIQLDTVKIREIIGFNKKIINKIKELDFIKYISIE